MIRADRRVGRLPDGVAVVGAARGVGKTVVAGALASIWRQQGLHVGVFKPVVPGCRRRAREGLVSRDAEFLAHCADSPHELAVISPVRFAEEFWTPSVRPTLTEEAVREEVERSHREIRQTSDLMLVEAAGGLLEPVTARLRMLDLLTTWNLPLVVVAPVGALWLNPLLLTLELARKSGLRIEAVVLNRYQPDGATRAEEAQPEAIARLGATDLPAVVPADAQTSVEQARLGADVLSALEPLARAILRQAQ